MLMAGCQRRSGNFQRAMELYRQVHRRFPNNVECKEEGKNAIKLYFLGLKFLVQMCKELRMPVEERDYTEKLNRLEKIGQLRAQRESDSAGQR
jgi:intraflagellar transport protein 88